MSIDDPLVGRTVGQYQILARVAGGGMGVVYTARASKLGRVVALKFLPPQWSHDEGAKQRFVREAQAASATNHPNICTIHDIETADDGQLFIVMAYYEGETLKKRLESGALAIEDALIIAMQVADGLAKAHAQGVVHRDIKPGNLILTEDGVRILDFGLATFADALKLTSESAPLGTIAYMSPEQVRGHHADARGDVWSTGAVLYEMLTGHPPFRGSHPEAVGYAIRNESPAPIRAERPDVPEDVEQLVFRALHKEPTIRYQSGRELARALRLVQGLSVPVDLRSAPVAIPPQIIPRARARIGRWAAVAASGLLLAAGVWSLWPAERVPVAVVPVINLTGYPELNPFTFALTQELESQLQTIAAIRVLPHERLLEIAGRFRVEQIDPSSREAMQTIATKSGARLLIVPTVIREGDAWKARLEIRDPATGLTDRYETEPVTSSLMKEAVYGLMPALTLHAEDHFASGWARAATTLRRWRGGAAHPARPHLRTLDAALEFEKGLQAFDQYEFSTAHAAFAAAAVRDSSNPLPLAWQSRTETLMRRDKEAVDTATQALRLLTEDVVDRDRLFVEAVANEARGDASVAAARYQDLVSRYPDEVGWLIERAGFEDRNGRAADAVSSYHAALAADPSLVRPHVELCRLYVPTRLNEPVLAKQQGELARAKYNALGHASGQAQALWCLVDVMRRGTEHDVAGAKRHAEAALTLMQGLGYPYGLSRAYNYLAFVALAENRNADAAALWEKSLALGRQVGYVLLESRVLMNLGVAYEALGQRETALTRYRESFDRFEEMGNEQDAASSQVNAAVIQIQFGRDPEQGLRDAQNALAVFRKIGDKNFEVFARLHIAAFYRHTARWEEAERELAQADALSTQNNLPSKKTRVDIELGRLYFDRGAYAKALPRFTSALVNSPPNDRLQAWIGLGRTHARVGDLASARGDLQKASQELETQGDSGSLAALSLAQGELAYESEQHADARAHFNRASAWWTSSFPDPASLDARAYLGFLDAVSGHSSGRELLVQTLAQARQMQRASLAARCQLFLVRLAILGRQFDEAQTRLRDLSPAVESLLAPELRAQLHHWRAQLLVQSNQPQRAAEEAAAAGRSMADLRSLVPDTDRDRVLSRPDLRFIH